MGIIKFLTAGIILGLPFGPVGIMCMGKTIEKGRRAGFASALGAITVDVIYSVIAFLILIPAKGFIEKNDFILRVLVGVFLLIVGATKLFGKVNVTNLNLKKSSDEMVAATENKEEKESFSMLAKEYLKIFLISIPNAFNVITIITIFTALRVFEIKENFLIVKLMIGIFLGNIIFWSFTTYTLSVLRNKITEKSIVRVVRLCGLAIMIFGISLELQALSSIWL